MSFQNIYSKNITGMLDYASNTLGLNGSCVAFNNIYQGCNGPGTSGICGAWITTDTTSSANINWGNFVNNLPPASTNGGTTFDYSKNSSSDKIQMPLGTTVDYAVLVWSGNNGSGSMDVSTKAIDFTRPSGQKQSILPEYTVNSELNDGYYTCSSDVTSIVEQGGSGYYTVGNVYSEFRTNIASAGWLLIVVYKSPSMGFVNININIGSMNVSDGLPISKNLSGFRTSEEGEIRAGIIISALNGNPASAGDQISLTNSQGNETYIYGPLNPVDNFFGAQIIDIDGRINSDATFGNLNATPASVQVAAGRRMGYDVSLVNMAPALSNNQTSTTLTASTTGNGYYINSITSIVRNASPNISVTGEVSTATANLDDSYTLTYNISNTGTLHTDTVDFTFDDTGLDFVEGSYSIFSSTIANQINSTPNSLVISNLEPNDIVVVSLTYKAKEIPNNLIYENRASVHYTFSVSTDIIENTIQATIPMNIESTIIVNTTNAQSINEVAPIITPTLPSLNYSISKNPVLGQVSVSNQGMIIYSPNNLTINPDTFTVKVVNTISNNSVNLNYVVNSNIVPELNVSIDEIPKEVLLGSTVEYIYTLQNQAEFDITNANSVSGVSPGYELISAKITAPNGQIKDVNRTGSYYSIGTLPANSITTISVLYLASKISTDLFYKNYSSLEFIFGNLTFNRTGFSDAVDIIASLNYYITNDQSYVGVIPITNPTFEYLSYSIKTQGSLGNASVDNSGNIVYEPSINAIGTDTVTVNIQNSLQNNYLDVNYIFNITAAATIPCSQSISSKLLYLLENDIYLKDVEKESGVCFDCNLWNNGYILSTGNVLIKPIKNTLASLIINIKYELQSILNPTIPNNSCNDYGFKSQIDRFLNTINDFENKILSLPCSTNCVGLSIYNQFLDILSRSINEMIVIMSTIEGIIEICNSNCKNCIRVDALMPTLVNAITEFSAMMSSWNYLFMNFISYSNMYTKPYVASFVPNQQIIPKDINRAYGHACPPRKQ